jgi:anti-sigma B factor antagonist
MEIHVDQVEGISVAVLGVDELDAGNSPEFKRDIAPVLQANTKLVLDLSRLRFVDSSGLGAILSCLRQISLRNGELKLCGLSRQVRAAFELVRMHRVFDIAPTREEAVHAFAH